MLSEAQHRALTEMIAAEDREVYEDAEIVCDGLQCWIGPRQVSWATVHGLLALCALRDDGDGKRVHRFGLNSVGRVLARHPSFDDEVRLAIYRGRPFDVAEVDGAPVILPLGVP